MVEVRQIESELKNIHVIIEKAGRVFFYSVEAEYIFSVVFLTTLMFFFKYLLTAREYYNKKL